MSFRPIKSQQRYLSVDLNALVEVSPDWLLVFFELLRQQKTRKLCPGEMIEMRKPIWDAAGVATLDRRKKIMNHLERVFPNDIIGFDRRRGKVPRAIVGTKMVEFHSESGLAVAPAKVAIKQNGYFGESPQIIT